MSETETTNPKHTHEFPATPDDTSICLVTDCDLTYAEHLEIKHYTDICAPLTEEAPAPEPLHLVLLSVRQAIRDGDAPLAILAYIERALTEHEFDLDAIDAEPNGGPSHEPPRPVLTYPSSDDLPEEIRGVARVINAVEQAETTHWGPDPAFGNLTRHVGIRENCSGPDCEDDSEPEYTTEEITYWEQYEHFETPYDAEI